MAKSMPDPWLLPFALGCLAEPVQGAVPGAGGVGGGVRVVQVISVEPNSRTITISDQQHSVRVFLTPKAAQALDWDMLNRAQVKMSTFHATTGLQASGEIWDLRPFALQCSSLKFLGASDLVTIGNPQPLLLHPAVVAALRGLDYATLYRRLVVNQFADQTDLADCEGQLYEAGRFDEENPLDEDDCIVPDDQQAQLDALPLFLLLPPTDHVTLQVQSPSQSQSQSQSPQQSPQQSQLHAHSQLDSVEPKDLDLFAESNLFYNVPLTQMDSQVAPEQLVLSTQEDPVGGEFLIQFEACIPAVAHAPVQPGLPVAATATQASAPGASQARAPSAPAVVPPTPSLTSLPRPPSPSATAQVTQQALSAPTASPRAIIQAEGEEEEEDLPNKGVNLIGRTLWRTDHDEAPVKGRVLSFHNPTYVVEYQDGKLKELLYFQLMRAMVEPKPAPLPSAEGGAHLSPSHTRNATYTHFHPHSRAGGSSPQAMVPKKRARDERDEMFQGIVDQLLKSKRRRASLPGASVVPLNGLGAVGIAGSATKTKLLRLSLPPNFSPLPSLHSASDVMQRLAQKRMELAGTAPVVAVNAEVRRGTRGRPVRDRGAVEAEEAAVLAVQALRQIQDSIMSRYFGKTWN